MKFIQSTLYITFILATIAFLSSCAAKKPAYEPAPFVYKSKSTLADPVEQQNTKPVTTPPPAPKPAPAAAPAPVRESPVIKPQPIVAAAAPTSTTSSANFNFSNIQFEFNSGILKTDSYAVLDNVSSAMRENPALKVTLNGYASAEGTADHNMELSVARANAVKSYLINSGVPDGSMIAKGFGESNPVADNTSEAGKILNRRVEIKIKN